MADPLLITYDPIDMTGNLPDLTETKYISLSLNDFQVYHHEKIKNEIK